MVEDLWIGYLDGIAQTADNKKPVVVWVSMDNIAIENMEILAVVLVIVLPGVPIFVWVFRMKVRLMEILCRQSNE